MARQRKIMPYNLSKVINDTLAEYGDEVQENVNEITRAVSKAGAKAVKQKSLEVFDDVHLKKGRYGTGWTSTVETGRVSAQGTIYNYKYPGLPHLLENGNGRGFKGIDHIKPVEEQIVEEYLERVERDAAD